ncbi:MAG TPA: DUF3224 domain-containing protein [Candidatus Nanopelagicales bacterium]
MPTIATRLRIDDWDEQPVAQFDDGSRITRATVRLTEGADGLTSGGFESVMYYRPDGTSDYVAVLHLLATLDGRSGSFAAAGRGAFDGTTASGEYALVPDSMTGELDGLVGVCTSTSTEADYPFMPLELRYDLP